MDDEAKKIKKIDPNSYSTAKADFIEEAKKQDEAIVVEKNLNTSSVEEDLAAAENEEIIKTLPKLENDRSSSANTSADNQKILNNNSSDAVLPVDNEETLKNEDKKNNIINLEDVKPAEEVHEVNPDSSEEKTKMPLSAHNDSETKIDKKIQKKASENNPKEEVVKDEVISAQQKPKPNNCPKPAFNEADFLIRYKQKILSTLAAARIKRSENSKKNLEKILSNYNSHDHITNFAIRKLLGVSKRTATRYLNTLFKQGKIMRFGANSKTFYQKYS